MAAVLRTSRKRSSQHAFLRTATLQAMVTPQRTLAGESTLYGFAWRLKVDAGTVIYAHHGGDSMGARAFLYLEPGRRLVVALLSNLGGVPLGEKEAIALADLFAKRTDRPAR